MKRRWDDDVVFKNQARGTENRDGKEFINVCSHYIFLVSEVRTRLTRFLGPSSIRFPQAVHGMYSIIPFALFFYTHPNFFKGKYVR